METKICTKCGDEKDVGQFPKDKKCVGGRKARCRECISAYHRTYRATHYEHVRALEQASQSKRVRRRPYVPHLVHSLTITAACAICREVRPLHLHHEDYSQPNTVDGLCVRCHMRVHAAVRALKRIAF